MTGDERADYLHQIYGAIIESHESSVRMRERRTSRAHRWHVLAAFNAGMLWILAVGFVLQMCMAGCSSHVPRATQPSASLPFCFGFSYVAKGRTLQARACWQEQRICTEASRMVVKHGGLAHVTSVGDCEVE